MDRYCIKCGLVTTKQNDNLYLCKEGHENWINPAVGAVVYIINEKKVVFGVRSIEPNKGKLSLPGGFINVGETAEQAAVRESKEELGLDVELVDCLGTYATVYGNRPVLNVVFIARSKNREVIPSDDMIGGDPQWLDIEKLPKPAELAWNWYQGAQKDFASWWHQHGSV